MGPHGLSDFYKPPFISEKYSGIFPLSEKCDTMVYRYCMARQLWLAELLHWVYPGNCWICHQFVERGGRICGECEQRLVRLEQVPRCGACARPLAHPRQPCPYCLGKGVAHYDAVVAGGTYHEPLRELILQGKYHHGWSTIRWMAQRIVSQPHVRSLIEQTDVLIPVPLHWRRRWQRGYNQAQILAQTLARQFGKTVLPAVKRIRPTASQTQFHSHQRRHENVRQAFGLVRPGALAGRRVLVVDDVLTSGATLGAVGGLISGDRPASLHGLVLAVADPRRGHSPLMLEPSAPPVELDP